MAQIYNIYGQIESLKVRRRKIEKNHDKRRKKGERAVRKKLCGVGFFNLVCIVFFFGDILVCIILGVLSRRMRICGDGS